MSADPIRLSVPPPFEVWLVPLATAMAPHDAGLLDDRERERAARFVFDHDRRRYVAAHAALRRLLARRTGRAAHTLRFSDGVFGKPALEGEPRCAFSLSHSADHALVALADDGEIGVDIEQVRPLGDLDALARRCLTGAEQADVEAMPASARGRAFLRAWTRKEACMKALGTGLRIEPAAFDVGVDGTDRVLWVETPRGRVELIVQCLPDDAERVAAVARVVVSP